MKISVVIPVYNEAATVAELIGRVQAVAMTKEIIVVDDGSTDGTRERLAELEQQQDNLRIFFSTEEPGQRRCAAPWLPRSYGRL